ncbi:MAG: SRPBCC family protein [Gammaproteobacteria bacterium]
MPYDALVERNVDVPRSKVFAAFYDFGGISKLVPDAIASCDIMGEGVGCQRSIVLSDGGKVVERMDVAHNESVFAYSILENDAIPVDNYCAVVTLEDTADGGTSISYGSNWLPRDPDQEDELQELFAGLYNALIDGVVAASAPA